jgi:hypothetical protein
LPHQQVISRRDHRHKHGPEILRGLFADSWPGSSRAPDQNGPRSRCACERQSCPQRARSGSNQRGATGNTSERRKNPQINVSPGQRLSAYAIFQTSDGPKWRSGPSLGRRRTLNDDQRRQPPTTKSQVAALIDYASAGQGPGPSLLRLLNRPRERASGPRSPASTGPAGANHELVQPYG